VKKRIPIFVILGNPPYSGISANMGEWITRLIEEFKYVDGEHFGERKHWLQDDYVKFIRFAEWKINQVGKGVVGYITNHSYLDNPTFRGMRQHLMKSFDEIYVLDLHGSSLKKEKCPDGSNDENVFDIRQGVAISFFIRKETNQNDNCEVFHSERWGLRERKYEWLFSNDINTTQWERLHPHSPFYFFVLREEKYEKLYNQFWKITDVFPVSSVGVVTARDKFVIDFDKNALKTRIKIFRDLSIPDDVIEKRFKLKDTSTFELRKSRETLSQDKNWKEYFTEILYRLFDKRHIYYTNVVVERPLYKTMHHMMYKNLGLITSRQVLRDFRHAFITNQITNFNLLDTAGRFGSGYLFPLYFYHDLKKKGKESERKPNIGKLFYNNLVEIYPEKPTPEQILFYIYSVLYSNIYRDKYAENLRIDFPRVPLTSDYNLFIKMEKLGKKLVDLHLMKSEELNNPVAKFQGDGENTVKKPVHDEEEGKVYINKTQYFEGVEQDVWEYQIGGYQVLYKWFKDRKGRKLSLEDIKHYCKVVTALRRTIEISDEIDELYLDVEKDIIEFRENNEQNASLEKYAK